MCRGALSGIDVTSPHVENGVTVKYTKQLRQTRVPSKIQNRFTLMSAIVFRSDRIAGVR